MINNIYNWVGEYNPKARQVLIDEHIEPRKVNVKELLEEIT